MIWRIKYHLLIIILLISKVVNAQNLIETSELQLSLKDGTKLYCYQPYSMGKNTTNTYYYLPTNIHFPTTKSGKKSYSLLIYKDDTEEIKGGIMHWLLTWGLSQKQRKEAENMLKSKVGPNATLMGAVLPESVSGKDDFEIKGSNKLSQILRASIVNRGKTPLLSHSKIAIAFKFSKGNAIQIKDLYENKKEKKETYILMHFLVSFKKHDGRITRKIITIKQNLQSLNPY